MDDTISLVNNISEEFHSCSRPEYRENVVYDMGYPGRKAHPSKNSCYLWLLCWARNNNENVGAILIKSHIDILIFSSNILISHKSGSFSSHKITPLLAPRELYKFHQSVPLLSLKSLLLRLMVWSFLRWLNVGEFGDNEIENQSSVLGVLCSLNYKFVCLATSQEVENYS